MSEKPLSAGLVVLRRGARGWECLLLRAYRYWDFPKGRVDPGEDPLAAARREAHEEAGLDRLTHPWGSAYCETPPYAGGKIAWYYLAEAPPETAVYLPISAELGRPEHHEWRWCDPPQARALLVPRLQRVLDWALTRIDSNESSQPETGGG